MTTAKPPCSIENWTEEDVHHWLITEVKVHQTDADRFVEEEVSGSSLDEFKKEDILDLGIKHGPAVKITSYLRNLKKGSQHEPQFPAYVEKWTKEQVAQWLLQHVRIYNKYAVRFQEEDVSGDCLVCFTKQDLLDLEVKSGPAVRILSELRQLKNKPEPTLEPILHTSTDQTEAPNPTQPKLSLAQATASEQPESRDNTESKTDNTVENEQEKTQRPSKKASEKEEIQQPRPRDLGARRKETTVLQDASKIKLEIKKTLANLSPHDLKDFHFCLQEYSKSKHTPIPRCKLEKIDIMDTATLIIEHFSSKDALQVTKDVLKEINQLQLICDLEKNMGQLEQRTLSEHVLKKEANQDEEIKDPQSSKIPVESH